MSVMLWPRTGGCMHTTESGQIHGDVPDTCCCRCWGCSPATLLSQLQTVDPGLPAGQRFPGGRPARSGVRGVPGWRRPAGDPGRLAGHAAPAQPGPGGRTACAALGLAGAVFAFGADQLGHVGHAATHGCVQGGGVLHGAGSGHLLPGQGRKHPRKRAGQRGHRASGRRSRRVARYRAPAREQHRVRVPVVAAAAACRPPS